MYSNSYGYSVYKRNQVNMGNPYQVRHKGAERVAVEEPTPAETEDPQEKVEEILSKAREEAKLIIREAELEAQRLLEEAQTQSAEHIQEVEQKAKESGYRHGESTAQQHYQELLAEAEDFMNQAKTEYEDTIRSLEQDIVELSLNIAKKVLGAELEVSRDAILKISGEAIEACLNRDSVLLKVSGDDYDYVMENIERIRNSAGNIGRLEIRKDQTLARGSCIVDTGYGMVDGGLETKLEMIEQAFRGVMGDLDKDEQ